MKTAILENTNIFRVDSHGNGTAFSMLNKASMMEVYVQGDDAARFDEVLQSHLRAYGNPEHSYHYMTLNEVLMFIWQVYAPVAAPYGWSHAGPLASTGSI
ncbi:hypothetical protein [Rhizobium sp. Leaf341]|uniref:hypothetical protein n=1 Tax=Rhizobium sp. Leaf341 TaxID=1736344 RepID=UPI000715396F|nr:hypothetical protein [Rhizobium sp. Leaf341]KQR67856.1 hypothetical protein ASG03_10070 [Rhizobium sp. Leaf341]